jgi:hypothetical protein
MSISYNSIATEIARIVSSVKNTGNVYPFIRAVRTEEQLSEIATDRFNKRVAVWMIDRESIGDDPKTAFTNERGSLFTLHGFMGVEDKTKSALIFQQVIDDICDAFAPQGSLGELVEMIDPVQAPSIAFAQLAGYECHYAKLTLRVQEYLTH